MPHAQVDSHALCEFQSQAPDPGLGGLKIWGGVSQFCVVNIGFPTMGAGFERRNDKN